jgi:hypothetical protein
LFDSAVDVKKRVISCNKKQKECWEQGWEIQKSRKNAPMKIAGVLFGAFPERPQQEFAGYCNILSPITPMPIASS